MDKSAKKEISGPIDMKFIEKDSSEKKSVSNLRLKAVALQSDTFYTDFKKQDIVRLFKAYGTNVSVRSTKKVLGEDLIRILKDNTCIQIVNPHSLSPTVPVQPIISETQEASVSRTSEDTRTRTEISEPVPSIPRQLETQEAAVSTTAEDTRTRIQIL